MLKPYYDILSKERKNILPLLTNFKKVFYLAGGTGLAFLIGHRDSIDFDFFSIKSFSSEKLFKNCQEIFQEHKILKVQQDRDTITIKIDDDIKISFFYYPYKLVKNFTETEFFSLASIVDIGCMKLNAIINRSLMKDYIDLYFILQDIDLKSLIKAMQEKFSQIDTNLALKSLVYFEDVILEEISYKHNNKVSFNKVKKFLQGQVKNYFK